MNMQEGSLVEIDAIARKLSLEIHCALRLPEFNRSVLVCHHGLAFSIPRLKESPDWSWAKKEHDKVAGG